MKSYAYLLINLLTIIICFAASFDNRIKFNKHFGAYLKAALLAAIPYITWDIWFTKIGVWWFNENYTLGISIFGLPLEEYLFFFCIPFSCVFTYYCLNNFFDLSVMEKYSMFLTWLTVIVCLGTAIVFNNRIYPLVTSLTAAAVILLLKYAAKADWIGRASFTFFILMPGFFLVNGALTGTGLESPIVNYNPKQILNIRLLTIPIEDAVYGYTQFMIVVFLFKKFRLHSYE